MLVLCRVRILHLEQLSTRCGSGVELALLRHFVGQWWPWCDGQCASRRGHGVQGGHELGDGCGCASMWAPGSAEATQQLHCSQLKSGPDGANLTFELHAQRAVL